MSKFIMDASAVLAFVYGETGQEIVSSLINDSIIAGVNYTEAFSKLLRAGMEAEEIRLVLMHCCPRVYLVDRDQSEIAATIHAANFKLKVSYADSVCLALGISLKLPVLTADRKWEDLSLGEELQLQLIR